MVGPTGDHQKAGRATATPPPSMGPGLGERRPPSPSATSSRTSKAPRLALKRPPRPATARGNAAGPRDRPPSPEQRVSAGRFPGGLLRDSATREWRGLRSPKKKPSDAITWLEPWQRKGQSLPLPFCPTTPASAPLTLTPPPCCRRRTPG